MASAAASKAGPRLAEVAGSARRRWERFDFGVLDGIVNVCSVLLLIPRGLKRPRESAISLVNCAYVGWPGLAMGQEPGQVEGDGGQGELDFYFFQSPQPKSPHPALFFERSPNWFD